MSTLRLYLLLTPRQKTEDTEMGKKAAAIRCGRESFRDALVSSRLCSKEGKVILVECSEDKGRVMLKQMSASQKQPLLDLSRLRPGPSEEG